MGLIDGVMTMLGWGPTQVEPVEPQRVPTDEVLPMHHFDDNAINRSIILAWTLRFNDVLDADKLHDGLARLLEIGDWRKLGGRLRKGVSLYSTHVYIHLSLHQPYQHVLAQRQARDSRSLRVYTRQARGAVHQGELWCLIRRASTRLTNAQCDE